jgi:hypothetical protein
MPPILFGLRLKPMGTLSLSIEIATTATATIGSMANDSVPPVDPRNIVSPVPTSLRPQPHTVMPHNNGAPTKLPTFVQTFIRGHNVVYPVEMQCCADTGKYRNYMITQHADQRRYLVHEVTIHRKKACGTDTRVCTSMILTLLHRGSE